MSFRHLITPVRVSTVDLQESQSTCSRRRLYLEPQIMHEGRSESAKKICPSVQSMCTQQRALSRHEAHPIRRGVKKALNTKRKWMYWSFLHNILEQRSTYEITADRNMPSAIVLTDPQHCFPAINLFFHV